MKQLIRRYKRYIILMNNWIFKEKIYGLDFSMRNKKIMNGEYHGYAITPEKHINQIFEHIDINKEDNFLDIGCGKGFVCYKAYTKGFNNIEGIEFQEELYNVAKDNMKKLKLDNNITITCEDARYYKNYSEFNYFFLFNPFGEGIMKDVLKSIGETLINNPRKLTIIYYNPTCHKLMEEFYYANFKLILKEKIYDNMKDYYTYIYETESICK